MKYCIANWKMNLTTLESKLFLEELQKKNLQKTKTKIILCPSFTSLNEIKNNLLSNNIELGAQNVHQELKGAFTGEISIAMIKDCGAAYVILGHSERRNIFGESDRDINRKVHAVLEGGLKPILCIGETLEQREAGQTELVLRMQLEQGLTGVSSLKRVVIAYEPVWAIGTGVTPEVNQVQATHAMVREILDGRFDEIDSVPILYGGSVKPDNSQALIQVPGVNGFLIGGASLDVVSFTSIANSVEQVQMRKL